MKENKIAIELKFEIDKKHSINDLIKIVKASKIKIISASVFRRI